MNYPARAHYPVSRSLAMRGAGNLSAAPATPLVALGYPRPGIPRQGGTLPHYVVKAAYPSPGLSSPGFFYSHDMRHKKGPHGCHATRHDTS